MPAATSAASPDLSLTAPLLIPAPPGGRLRVEMDARSEDILGVMKSFLKGIGESGTRPLAPGQPAPPPNPVADLLASGNLADILKDVNHVHFAVYELAPPPAFTAPTFARPKPATKVMPLMTLPPATVTLTPAFDSNAFYETAFGVEGAHRIMFADADQYKLLMVGFPDRKGYAYAVSGAGFVAVSRADGYPNLEALSAFISRTTAAVMNSKTGKDLMHLPLDSFKPTSATPLKSSDSSTLGK